MLDADDIDPIRKTPKPRDLERLSRDELGDYIEALKAEITRAEQMIARKTTQHGMADSLFKK